MLPPERKASEEAARNGDPAAATVAPTDRRFQEDERLHFNLGLTTAPVIGVILLLASTSIGGKVLRNGIVGIQGVKPYDIMTLFISLVSVLPLLSRVVIGSDIPANVGVHLNLVGLHWPLAVPRFLGRVERRYLWTKALCLLLPLLLRIWRHRRQRKSTSTEPFRVREF